MASTGKWIAVISMLAASQAFECSRDSECGDSQYCAQGVCEHCIPCQDLYKRYPSSGPRKCAKSEIDCGACLRGFQAQELTGQRYSFKCYPANEETTEPMTRDFFSNFRPDVILFVVVGSLVSLVVLFFIFRAKRPIPIRTDEEKGQDEPLYIQEPPPPYNHSAPSAPFSEESEALIHAVAGPLLPVRVQRVTNVQATPIGPYHSSGNPLSSNQVELYESNIPYFHGNVWAEQVEEFYGNHEHATEQMVDLNATDSNRLEAESFSSTETIPSLWEPGSTPNLNRSQPDASPQTNPHRSCSHRPQFGRSVSLDSGTDRRNRSDEGTAETNSTQYLTLGPCHGINSGIHIQLTSQRNLLGSASYRNSIVSSEDGYNSELAEEAPHPSEFDDNVMEPEPPEPFTLPEQPCEMRPLRILLRSLSASQARGSEDSGVFEANNRRRRPATSDVIEFSFKFSIKRMREDTDSS